MPQRPTAVGCNRWLDREPRIGRVDKHPEVGAIEAGVPDSKLQPDDGFANVPRHGRVPADVWIPVWEAEIANALRVVVQGIVAAVLWGRQLNEDLGRLPRVGSGVPSARKRIEQQPPMGATESRRTLAVAFEIEVVMSEFARRT